MRPDSCRELFLVKLFKSIEQASQLYHRLLAVVGPFKKWFEQDLIGPTKSKDPTRIPIVVD